MASAITTGVSNVMHMFCPILLCFGSSYPSMPHHRDWGNHVLVTVPVQQQPMRMGDINRVGLSIVVITAKNKQNRTNPFV